MFTEGREEKEREKEVEGRGETAEKEGGRKDKGREGAEVLPRTNILRFYKAKF